MRTKNLSMLLLIMCAAGAGALEVWLRFGGPVGARTALAGATLSGATALAVMLGRRRGFTGRRTPFLVLAGAVLMFGMSGCACLKPSSAQLPQCVIERQSIDCAKAAGTSLLPVVGSIVAGLLNTGSIMAIDWPWLEQRLEAAGAVSGSCIFADIVNNIGAKATISSVHSQRSREAQDRLLAWKGRHGLSGVKLLLHPTDGGEAAR